MNTTTSTASGSTSEASKGLGLLDELRANPRLPAAIGVAAVVAVVAALWLWSRTPDYGILYSNLSDRDGGAIIASLQQMNIPYKFNAGGGALLVAADKVPEARLKLAALGLPKGGSVGFELMDNQKFGTSQFAEQVNYQRALEGELARSINSISAVESARVHLALPKQSLFVRDQKKPSASVVLTLHRGRTIDEGQVNAVVHLISSSVPELSAKSITVVDQAGNLLSAANAGTRGLDVSQLKYSQEIEQAYIRRIEAILQPIVGAANVHAQVTADIDFSTSENTEEKYRPNQEPGSAAVRSSQLSESSQQGGSLPGGVPGALTNQPGANPTAPIATDPPGQKKPDAPVPGQLKMSTEMSSVASPGGGATAGGSGRKDMTTNYELDRSIRHVQQSSGGIKRLSVAVVVNYRAGQAVQGKPTAQALSAAELEQIQNLVKEAMGYNRERGDTLNVVNSRFAADTKTEVELPIWRQPDNIDMAKTAGKYLLLGMLGLYLWFAVLRPLLRKVLQPVPPAPRPPASGAANAEAGQGVDPQATVQGRENKRHEDNAQYARDAAQKDPRMVAMLVQQWMEKKNG